MPSTRNTNTAHPDVFHDDLASSPPGGIDPAHVRPMGGPRRDSCEARPGLIASTHIAPLNEGLMSEEHMAGEAAKAKPSKARRDSCEARPGLIESTHIAPLNEGLMAEEHGTVRAAGVRK